MNKTTEKLSALETQRILEEFFEHKTDPIDRKITSGMAAILTRLDPALFTTQNLIDWLDTDRREVMRRRRILSRNKLVPRNGLWDWRLTSQGIKVLTLAAREADPEYRQRIVERIEAVSSGQGTTP